MSLRRTLRHGVRRLVTRPLLWLAFTILPRVYLAYMWFVWKTSRVDNEMESLKTARDENDGIICGLWHEEVFYVAWTYRDLHGHTLASLGDAGEGITRALELCNFVVFRGGSAAKSSRRREGVVRDMIDHMKTTPRVIYGITVDGSVGPRYRLKKGIVTIARECKRPVGIVRAWAKRQIRLPTWDRMAIPLPFNHIRRTWRGPWWVPADADTEEGFERFRRFLELELAKLAEESYRLFDQPIPPDLYARYDDEGGGTAAAPAAATEPGSSRPAPS